MDPQTLALLMGSSGQGNALTGQQPNPMMGQQPNPMGQTGGQDMGSLLRRAILMMRLRQMMGGQMQQPQQHNPISTPSSMMQQPQQNPMNALLMQLTQAGQGNMLSGGM